MKGEQKERKSLLPMLLLLLVMAVCYVCAIAALTPQRYDVIVGDIAEQTITSPRSIEDTEATEALRSAARKDAETIFTLDEALIETYVSGANRFFTDISELRSGAKELLYAKVPDAEADGRVTAEEWNKAVAETDLQNLLNRFELNLSTEDGYQLLYAEEGEVLRLQDAVLPKLITSLQSGLDERALPAKKTAYVQELNATSLSVQLKTIGAKALDAYLKPTYVIDEMATSDARDKAAAAVPPVEIKRGDVIVRQGEPIAEAQYDILRTLELVRPKNADLWLNIGVGLYILAIGSVFAAYLLFYQPRVFMNTKLMLIIAAAMVVTLLLELGAIAFEPRISTALIGVLLVALLVDSRVAMGVNIMLALTVGLMAGGRGSAMFGFDSMTMAAGVLVGGQTAIHMLRKYDKRGAVIAAGAVAGAMAALTVVATHMMTSKAALVTFAAAACHIGSNVIAAVLVVGMLSLWENLFDIATGARLNELSNANNPLLKQLMTEAPGTYHHSILTATLAEAAAEAIGADALLSRVGAYYHDVGKLKRPLYFKENQKPNENIHDTLPAGESSTIIIAHQKDGVTLLNKHKLPSAVVQISYEHHGNTLMTYFYHKAAKENGGRQLSPKLFRYPGARPSTKESAVVMLADSCEAGVRSLDGPSYEEVEALVDKIIKGKIDDGQLALCPLNFKELTMIQQSFLRTFNGLLHERIAYPGQEEH